MQHIKAADGLYHYRSGVIELGPYQSERILRAIRDRKFRTSNYYFDLQEFALPFNGIDDIINAITSGQSDQFTWSKISNAPVAAGVWHSTWAESGSPAAGGTDSGGTQYVNGSGGSGAHANAGGFGFATINVSPLGRVALSFSCAASQPIIAEVADRLCAIGPVTVTSTGSKTLTTLPALPRYTNGIGVEAWLEMTTASTTSIGKYYLDSYTGTNNGSGTNATTSNEVSAISATIKVGDMVGPFPLLTPDVGVTAIASFNVATAPSTGAVNVVLLRRMSSILPIPVAGSGNSRNLISQIPSMPIIYDGATLFVMWNAINTTAPNLQGDYITAYK